jgi:hypothetical protein
MSVNTKFSIMPFPTDTSHTQVGSVDPDPAVSRIARFLWRLVIGGLVWLVFGVLAISSAIPYGGSNALLLILWMLATLAAPAWAIFAFFQPIGNEAPKMDDKFDLRCPYCSKITPRQYQDCTWCHRVLSPDPVVKQPT